MAARAHAAPPSGARSARATSSAHGSIAIGPKVRRSSSAASGPHEQRGNTAKRASGKQPPSKAPRGAASSGKPRRESARDVAARSTSGGLAARSSAARARTGTPSPRTASRRAPAAASHRTPAAASHRTPAAAAAASQRAATPRRATGGRAGGGPDVMLSPRATAVGATALDASPSRAPARKDREVPRHLRLVDTGRLSKLARRRRARALVAVAALGAVLVVFSLVYLHVVSAQKQFEIDRLQARDTAVQNTYEDLRLEVDERDTPAHIMAIALAHGMVEPGSVTFLHEPAGTPPRPATVGRGNVSQQAPAGAADWTRIKGVLSANP